MSGVVVTLKSNIATDEEGKFLFDEDENIILTDEDDVGMLVKTHVFPLSQVDPGGNLMTGYVSRSEIYWDKRRNPSPDLVDPNDLVWISFAEANEEEGQEDTDDYDDLNPVREVEEEVLDQ